MTNFLSIDAVFFTVLGYPMSYIEYFGTLFTLAAVWLVARKSMWNWPASIIGAIIFGFLFYQIRLYADFFEQIYYFITSIIGWIAWTRSRKPRKAAERIEVHTLNTKGRLLWAGGILAVSLVSAWTMSRIHIWLPGLFPEPASFVLLDATTTIMSFAAMILMVKRLLENWVLWIVVDIVAIGLYWVKGVPFIALLYVLFLGIATKGFIDWRATYRREHETE